jgi:ribosomal protein L30/L7E
MLETTSLSGDHRRLPADLTAPTVVILAFHRWQQAEVDAWIEELQEGGCPHPIVEVPTIGTRYRLARSFIDGGMRAGIQDVAIRQRTLTVYTDVRRVLKALGLRSTDHVVVALVDPSGSVRALVQGPYDLTRAGPFVD